ncbi:DUF4913 domain-containing protein [Oerskovia sp. USHLN155]
MYVRDMKSTSGRRWCPDWWRHAPETVYRLDGIWRAWEHLRRDRERTRT